MAVTKVAGGWAHTKLVFGRPIVAMALGVGCATVSTPEAPAVDPARATAEEASRAIEAGDGDALHALLSPRRRATVDAAACRKALSVVPPEQRKTRVSGDPRVEVTIGEEARVTFVLENGAYRLLDGVPAFDRRDTPAAAFTTFAHAIRARDSKVLATLVPAPRRAEVPGVRLDERLEDAAFVAQTEAVVRALEGATGELRGDGRWRLSAKGHEAVFEREPGGWVLVDLH